MGVFVCLCSFACVRLPVGATAGLGGPYVAAAAQASAALVTRQILMQRLMLLDTIQAQLESALMTARAAGNLNAIAEANAHISIVETLIAGTLQALSAL